MVGALKKATLFIAYYFCAFHPNGAFMLDTVQNTKPAPDGRGDAPFFGPP